MKVDESGQSPSHLLLIAPQSTVLQQWHSYNEVLIGTPSYKCTIYYISYFSVQCQQYAQLPNFLLLGGLQSNLTPKKRKGRLNESRCKIGFMPSPTVKLPSNRKIYFQLPKTDIVFAYKEDY